MSGLCIALMLAVLGSGEVLTEDIEVSPRPDWERSFVVLNGDWQFDFDPADAGVNEKWFDQHAFTKKIHVPFPWQSKLSGIADTQYQGAAWYQRDITTPKSLRNKRIFLIFGAVDFRATVWLDGKQIAEHEGGYTPFEIDITSLVTPGKPARLTVRAFDNTDPETPTGKQIGWYTPSGGIWQTVYLEFRGESFVRSAHITPDIEKEQATFDCVVEGSNPGDYTLEISAAAGVQCCQIKQPVSLKQGANTIQIVLPVKFPQLWSPDSPTLYETQISLLRGKVVVDTVKTYFGMRKISRGVYGKAGHEYILLNNKPIYLRGALHQSFNPDGLYTHPDDAYLRNDYVKAKEFGLNFLRIHIKVDEPRALYWADKLGVMLMCDMPCFGKKSPRAEKLWEATLRETLARDFNHPSVISWVDFNETWGIGDGGYTPETQQWVQGMYRLTKQLDPTRLVEDNSPCEHDHVETDINSWHFYIDDPERSAKHIAEVVEKTVPGSEFNYTPGYKQATAPLINSEYGGVGAGSGDRDISWVFLFLTNQLRKYEKICGYIYTELEDIEWEHNGFMNYDRSPKDFNYPAKIKLTELQGDDFPVIDCPPYQKVEMGTQITIPVLVSHWSERENLDISISIDGSTIDGTPWSQWLKPIKVKFKGEPYRVTPVDTFNLALPDACGLMNFVVEISQKGQRLAANYCVVEVINGKTCTRADEYAATFPVNAFSNYTFADMPLLIKPTPGKLCGQKTGYVEYQVTLPKELAPESIKACRLVTEIGAKAGEERLDWPARKNPADYPQTDGKATPTDVAIGVNGQLIKQLTVANDFADARGVLSHVARRDYGSCGMLVEAPVEGPALDTIKQALSGDRILTLRFEIPADAQHPGGLSLYGEGMGSRGASPMLIFTLEPGSQMPLKPAKPVNRMKISSKSLLKCGPKGSTWRYTVEKPAENWIAADFDDHAWSKGRAGFGKTNTPHAQIGTEWTTNDIWLRNTITFPAEAQGKSVMLDLYHDEDVEIFVNGKPLLSQRGNATEYEHLVLSPEQAALFTPGSANLIAVHCHQTAGGQCVDVGLSVMK